MTVLELLTIAAVLGAGAILQSAVGFGLALVAVPLLVLDGRSLPAAVALVLGAALVQTAHGSYVAREHIRWKLAFVLAGIQWVALLGGVAVMSLLVDSDPARLKQAVGAAVLAAITARLLIRPVPRERVGRGWAVLAAVTAGLLAGSFGMGGPPLALFALAHSWERDAFRAFLWSQFLLVLPVLAILLAFRFGPETLLWVAGGVATAPVVWGASRLGLKLTARWDRRRLQLAAAAVLYAIGLVALLGPLLR